MARSYKKTPISGHCSSRGQKQFKVQEHRRERSRVRRDLRTLSEEDYDHPDKQEYNNEWDSPRDGKFWLGGKDWPADILRRCLSK